METSATKENTTQPETDSGIGLDEESDWDEEEAIESETATSTAGKKAVTNGARNTFRLEFIGERRPVTDYHPYVVTR